MPTPSVNSAALFSLNGSGFGGACIPNPTGFTWNVVGVFREPATNRKDVIGDILADSLDTDSLATIRDKIAAAVKAKGLEYGYTVTTVTFFTMATIAV